MVSGSRERVDSKWLHNPYLLGVPLNGVAFKVAKCPILFFRDGRGYLANFIHSFSGAISESP